MVLNRKLLRHLMKPAVAVSVDGVYCWISHKDPGGATKLTDIVLICVRAFDKRKIAFKLLDLLGRPVKEGSITTSHLGVVRFYRLEPILS